MISLKDYILHGVSGKKEFINDIYARQVANSKKRDHGKPKYTAEELYEWAIQDDNYNKLHNEWLLSGSDSELVPSFDRINNKKGYSFTNLQTMTWGENNSKGRDEWQVGVLKFTLNGDYVREYDSILLANADTDVSVSSIATNVNGKTYSAGDHIYVRKDKFDYDIVLECVKAVAGTKIMQFSSNGLLLAIHDDIKTAAALSGVNRSLIGKAFKEKNVAGKNIWIRCKDYTPELLAKAKHETLIKRSEIIHIHNGMPFIFENTVAAQASAEKMFGLNISVTSIFNKAKDENNSDWHLLKNYRKGFKK